MGFVDVPESGMILAFAARAGCVLRVCQFLPSPCWNPALAAKMGE